MTEERVTEERVTEEQVTGGRAAGAPRTETLVIANCGGFWGDDPGVAARQVAGGPVDVLVMDYLAEVTMAILQKQRQRRPELGYAADLLAQLRDVLADCAGRGITVISNGGGVNPTACGAAIEVLGAELGIADRLTVGVVTGDDLFERLGELVDGGEPLDNMETGAPLAGIRDRIQSANVYLGAAPIVAALRQGANVVIAGRVTDTAVTLAPMIDAFGWAPDDWDRLAAGIVAGHIIECGSQACGGNFTDWRKVPSWADMGYPLIEAHPDGSFVVTKHPGTGGLVSVDTVTEQLLYEMGSPAYLAPDCIAHFDSIRLRQDGPDRVHVSGITGSPPPEKLKVAVSYAMGHRIVGRIAVTGPDTLAKARQAAEIFWGAAGGEEAYDRTATQFIGWDATHPSTAAHEPGELLVQVSALDADAAKLDRRFAPFVVGKGLASIPGFAAPADQGRPRASAVLGHWPALVSRDAVGAEVTVDGSTTPVDLSVAATTDPATLSRTAAPRPAALPGATAGTTTRVPLIRLCLARSGDKGDTCNVGVIARSDEIFHWMLDELTPAVVRRHFDGVCFGEVERFELPNLRAVNFLLHESLGGGGTASLRFDPQGKTFGQFLLGMEVEVDTGLVPG